MLIENQIILFHVLWQQQKIKKRVQIDEWISEEKKHEYVDDGNVHSYSIDVSNRTMVKSIWKVEGNYLEWETKKRTQPFQLLFKYLLQFAHM